MSGLTQKQLIPPLLAILEEHDRGLTAREASIAVAESIGVSAADRERQVTLPSGQGLSAFDRDVRWARQKAKLMGMVDGSVRNLWRLTPSGKRDLRNAAPGIVITVFETALGQALWAEAEAAYALIEDGSINSMILSPPYPIATAKTYGGRTGAEYLDWMVALAREWRRCLAPDGSLVINLGDAWDRGGPTLSLYQERLLLRLCDDLGYHLAQRFTWHNPARLPSPAEYVTIRRVRVNPATETIWWLSPSRNPKADNRRVLRPYSGRMKRLLEAGGETQSRRPSGHVLSKGAFGQDRGGSIPHNLIEASNTTSNDQYQRYCRNHGLPAHPARFPAEVPDFFIRLTTEPGDVVSDPFSGSCTTAAVAERLGRRWLAVEQSMTYLQGAVARFPDVSLLCGSTR